MSQAALVWDPRLADYDLGDGHPLNPIRLVLAASLMDSLGLLGSGSVLAPTEASEDQLRLVHSAGYIEAVRHAGDWASDFRPHMGLGTEDNPVYPGMHEIAALTCGGSILAMSEVLSGSRVRALSIAGGMHHAHKARAAGFSIYNDAAVAIAVALENDPDLRVLYLDIDAHHGDGVQEAFADRARYSRSLSTKAACTPSREPAFPARWAMAAARASRPMCRFPVLRQTSALIWRSNRW